MNLTIENAVRQGEATLKKAGLAHPRMEAEVLLGGLLDQSRMTLILRANETLPNAKLDHFKHFIDRRAKFEPVAYIQKKKNFMGLDFIVTPDVLVPRSETENVVEKVDEWIRLNRLNHPKILDLGTGSGCMALTLAKRYQQADITALDISPQALRVAKMNAKALGIESSLTFVESNLYAALNPTLRGYFDIIISNPPYISRSELDDLDPDLTFEPRIALDGGPDGFQTSRPIIHQAPRYLTSGGVLFLEIGWTQKVKTINHFEQTGFKSVFSFKDDAGRDRMVGGRFIGSV